MSLPSQQRTAPLARIWGAALKGLAGVSAAAVFAMMILMTLDVIGREALNSPLVGALELIELTLAVTVFAALPLVSWRENHITADLFDAVLGRRTRSLFRAMACFLGACAFLLPVPRLKVLTERSASFGDVTAQLGIPLSWALYFILTLCVVTALAFATRAVAHLQAALGAKRANGEGE